MWRVWAPVVLLWQVLPNAALHSHHGALAPLTWWPRLPAVPWIASGAAILALGLTIPCWLGMGTNWSMAIVPGKKTELLTRGPFRVVRHPIYSLSIVLMTATLAAFPSPAMLLAGVAHIAMLHLKARSEERFLLNTHSQSYADYCRRTGRFAPRIFAARG
jgi:protein-S-isoprenylcysteine O-methyltransferase Ste14